MKYFMLACAMLFTLLTPAIAQTVKDPTQQPPAPFPGGTLILSPPQPVYQCGVLEDLLSVIEATTVAAATEQFNSKRAPGKDGIPLCDYLYVPGTNERANMSQLVNMVYVQQYPSFPDGIGGQVTPVVYQGKDSDGLRIYVAVGHVAVGGVSYGNNVFDLVTPLVSLPE